MRYRLKILDRYLLREVMGPFLVSLLFFTFVFIMGRIFDLVGLAVEKDVPIITVIKLFLFMLPFTFAITVPMGILMGVIMAVSRLSADFEITALRSSGISIYRIFRPLMILGAIFSILMLIFNETILPAGNQHFVSLYAKVHFMKPTIVLEEGLWTKIENISILVEKIDHQKNEMYNIRITEYDRNKKELKRIFAKRGKWLRLDAKVKTLRLFNGTIHEAGEKPGEYHIIEFPNTLDYNLNISEDIQYEDTNTSRNENSFEIIKKIKAEKAKKKPSKRAINRYLVEIGKRNAIPVACLIFMILGAPLGIVSRRSGRGMGFVFSLIIIVIYYVFLTIGEDWGISGLIQPYLSMWLGNIFFSIIGIILLVQADSQEKLIDSAEKIKRLFLRIFDRTSIS